MDVLTIPSLSLLLPIAVVAYWFIGKWTTRKNHRSRRHHLPPGSDGLPFVGEALHLLLPAKDFDLIPFLKTRIQRYGPIFRTKLFGHQVVVTSDSDFNNFLLHQEDVLIQRWHTPTFTKLFAEGMNADVSTVHKYIKLSILRIFGITVIKEKLLPEIYRTIDDSLRDWSAKPCVEVKYASSDMALGYGAKLTFGHDPRKSKENLLDLYFSMTKSMMSIPLNFPGTAHHRCLKNKEKVVKMIRDELETRQKQRSMPQMGCKEEDFLDRAIREMNDENDTNIPTENFIVNLIFMANFVAHDTVSSPITLAVKLIEEHPLVLQQLVAENEKILKARKDNDEDAGILSWSEYKSMTFTLQVVNEVLRLGNIAPGMMRKAKQDIQINGYTIPAGTGILIATAAMHLNPQTYEDPLAFNPWRWEGKRASEMYRDFMPFGWGMKQCAGAEYARVFIATFIHVLVAKYTWKTIKGGELRRNPILDFGDGLHVKFMHKK